MQQAESDRACCTCKNRVFDRDKPVRATLHHTLQHIFHPYSVCCTLQTLHPQAFATKTTFAARDRLLHRPQPTTIAGIITYRKSSVQHSFALLQECCTTMEASIRHFKATPRFDALFRRASSRPAAPHSASFFVFHRASFSLFRPNR